MIISEEIKADLKRAKVACLLVLSDVAVRSHDLAEPIRRLGGFDSITLVPSDLGIRSQQGRARVACPSKDRVLLVTRSDVFVVACFTRSETFILDQLKGEVRHPTRSPCTMTPNEIVAECFGVLRIMPEYWDDKHDRLTDLLMNFDRSPAESEEIDRLTAEFEFPEVDDV